MSKELLSSSLDNAASREDWDALLDAMDQDPTLKSAWSRAHQLRDVQANVGLNKGHDLFCAGVMAALAKESQDAPATVVRLPASRTLPAPALPEERKVVARKWATWVPVSAAAGALAAALLFGLGKPESSTFAPAAVAALNANPADATAIQPVRWNAATASNPQSPTPDADTEALLDSYLMEHSNSVASQDVGGALAGARFAVQAASYQPGE